MAKFENDLDLTKAHKEAVKVKNALTKLVNGSKPLRSSIDKLLTNNKVLCYIFSKSIAFRIGRSSIKNIPNYSAGFKTAFPGNGLAKKYYFPIKVPTNPKTNLNKYDIVYYASVYFLIYYFNRVKSESDKTEAVESEQVVKVQNDLKKLIKEYGSVRLKVGDELYDVTDFKQVSGRPKADMVFTNKGNNVIFVSHKKGGAPAAFQQYGGFAADLQIKDKGDASKYPQVYKFIEDIEMVCKGLGVSKDATGRYDLNDLRKGTNFARIITNEHVAHTVMFGKDFKSNKVGLDNCSILIDGDIIFKPIRTNTFELKGSYHTYVNPVLKKRKVPYQSNSSNVYTPAMFLLKSEQQGLRQAGFANARAVIWPNNKIIQGYRKQFDDMYNAVKSKNNNKIKSIKEEYLK